jgi:hypothetical protein
MELSTLTMQTRQPQRTTNEATSKIRPTSASVSPVSFMTKQPAWFYHKSDNSELFLSNGNDPFVCSPVTDGYIMAK